MENESQNPPIRPIESQAESSAEQLRRQRMIVIGAVIGGLILLALMVLAIIFLLNPSTPTAKIRDIFIIFMALETLVLGLTLVILIVQIARLINLLQNEIKPILESTNETVNTLRGTTTFLSENLVEPVIKLNEYLAALQKMLSLIGLARGRTKGKKDQGG
jgi:uncharacterized membrane protein